MRRISLSVLTLLIAGVTTSLAQEAPKDSSQSQSQKVNQLGMSLNMLGRGEMRYGGFTGGTGETSAKFLMGRTRLSLDYTRPHLEAKVTAQHVGIWGAQGGGDFNLHEAWAKLSMKIGLFAQVGRQVLSYDDERIIGANDWAMVANYHDVIRLGYEGYGHKAHAIFGFNQNGENISGGTYYSAGDQPYKIMHTLWYHYDVSPIPLGVSLLFMNLGMQAGKEGSEINPPKTVYQQLLGGFVSYRAKRWSVEGSYYHQFGTTITDADPTPETDWKGVKLDAWMASIKAQMQLTKNLDVMVGYDYLSGDDYNYVRPEGMVGMAHHDKIRYFNPVYGSHHKFYGMMDFFYVQAFSDTFSPGLQDLYAGATYSPVKGLNLTAAYHYLAAATNLKDNSRTLGHDIDIEASYRILKDASISLGFSYMIGTKTMESLKRADANNNLKWAWFTLVVSPRLFTVKW